MATITRFHIPGHEPILPHTSHKRTLATVPHDSPIHKKTKYGMLYYISYISIRYHEYCSFQNILFDIDLGYLNDEKTDDTHAIPPSSCVTPLGPFRFDDAPYHAPPVNHHPPNTYTQQPSHTDLVNIQKRLESVEQNQHHNKQQFFQTNVAQLLKDLPSKANKKDINVIHIDALKNLVIKKANEIEKLSTHDAAKRLANATNDDVVKLLTQSIFSTIYFLYLFFYMVCEVSR